jgi:CRISPR-associated endonuclease Cas1 subtype I-E
MMRDLHILPKVCDSWSYLYVERARIEQDDKAIAVHDETWRVPVPCASLAGLMLGPRTAITHAVVRMLVDCGCRLLWVAEQGVRLYAQGMGETRSARNLLRQSRLCTDPSARLRVVERTYRIRFTEQIGLNLSLRQIRGSEGIRVRETYARLSRQTGVAWYRRSHNRGDWHSADPINRAVSAANSCPYGVCHAAIVSAGYSPALGFVQRLCSQRPRRPYIRHRRLRASPTRPPCSRSCQKHSVVPTRVGVNRASSTPSSTESPGGEDRAGRPSPSRAASSPLCTTSCVHWSAPWLCHYHSSRECSGAAGTQPSA